MFSKAHKHIIAQLFLFAFILLKASGLHAFVHTHDSADQINKCILCHVSVRDQITPNITPEPIEIPAAPLFVAPIAQTVCYTAIFYQPLTLMQPVNRPPPYTL